ncbi:MAG: hypothetical protein SVX43_23190 [Cyanobacteriota bacterium]|nr:hypothetical protein [Cyanobacteriota bacterium]
MTAPIPRSRSRSGAEVTENTETDDRDRSFSIQGCNPVVEGSSVDNLLLQMYLEDKSVSSRSSYHRPFSQ